VKVIPQLYRKASQHVKATTAGGKEVVYEGATVASSVKTFLDVCMYGCEFYLWLGVCAC